MGRGKLGRHSIGQPLWEKAFSCMRYIALFLVDVHEQQGNLRMQQVFLSYRGPYKRAEHLQLICTHRKCTARLGRVPNQAIHVNMLLVHQARFGFTGLATQTLASLEEDPITSYSPLGWSLLLTLAQIQGTRNMFHVSFKGWEIEVKRLAQSCKQTLLSLPVHRNCMLRLCL